MILAQVKFDCQICISPINAVNNLQCTHCGMTWCQKCIEDWIKSYKNCPNCKKELNKKLLIKNIALSQIMAQKLEDSYIDPCRKHKSLTRIMCKDCIEPVCDICISSNGHKNCSFMTIKELVMTNKDKALIAEEWQKALEENMKLYSNIVQDEEFRIHYKSFFDVYNHSHGKKGFASAFMSEYERVSLKNDTADIESVFKLDRINEKGMYLEKMKNAKCMEDLVKVIQDNPYFVDLSFYKIYQYCYKSKDYHDKYKLFKKHKEYYFDISTVCFEDLKETKIGSEDFCDVYAKLYCKKSPSLSLSFIGIKELKDIDFMRVVFYCPKNTDIYIDWIQPIDKQSNKLKIRQKFINTAVLNAILSQMKELGLVLELYSKNTEECVQDKVQRFEDALNRAASKSSPPVKNAKIISKRSQKLKYKEDKDQDCEMFMGRILCPDNYYFENGCRKNWPNRYKKRKKGNSPW
ncbi:unnamed protein product [Moneuplotes crassus]|uniref:RING-type domain-containing protein n=1 Tax=Euplotes crassus TaxID=5936 RepID=A0AAD1UKV7_EUPCR|nr:unnamed protein product [Moneuplotes crassus]